MKNNTFLFTVLFALLSFVNIPYAADFTTTVIKPVDNLGNEYFTNEIAGFTTYNPTTKVADEPGTYTKKFTKSSFDISASDLIVKDVMLDKEEDTIRYKLIGLKGTEKAENLTQTCNFDACDFEALKIGSSDKQTELVYEYSRQYRVNIEGSNSLTKELPKTLITHNNVKNNFINTDKGSLKIVFEIKNDAFNDNEFLFNVASINEDYKQHIMLRTFKERNLSYLQLIGFSDKGQHTVATWSLSDSNLALLKDKQWHRVELNLINRTLMLDDEVLLFATAAGLSEKKFDDISTNIKGEVIVVKKPSDIRRNLFPSSILDYSGDIRGFSIYGLGEGLPSAYPVNFNKNNLAISFDVPARMWADNETLFEISREGEDARNSLNLYMSLKGDGRDSLQLDKDISAGYLIDFQNEINNKSRHIEIKSAQRIGTKTEIKKVNKTKNADTEASRHGRDWVNRDGHLNDFVRCMGESRSSYATGNTDYWVFRSYISVKFSWYGSGDYSLKIIPQSVMTNADYLKYQRCIKAQSWGGHDSGTAYVTISDMFDTITTVVPEVLDKGDERTVSVRIDDGPWQELTKDTGLKNFLQGGSYIRGDLKLPSQTFVKNFKINNKAYANDHQLLYRMQEPTLVQGSKEIWVNEGDGVTFLTPVKGDQGLTVQSNSFTVPNGSPSANIFETTTIDGEEYYSVTHTETMRPSDAGTARWQFGAKIYEFKATIGDAFTLDNATIYDGEKGDDYRLKTREQVDALLLAALTKAEPTVTPVVETVPAGTAITNAYVYSPINPDTDVQNHGRDLYTGEIYFTRPGRYRLSWVLDSQQYPVDISGIQQLVVEVNVGWPAQAHYHQVAETNPVPLDANEYDDTFFKEIRLSEKYKLEDGQYIAEPGTVEEIKLDENQAFSFNEWTERNKNSIYRSVLYFTESQNGEVAQGDLTSEKVLIRVVESRHWSNDKGVYPLVDNQSVIIGDQIVDEDHTVVEHTGCIVKSDDLKNARYNVNTYDPISMSGAIFAVNQEVQGDSETNSGSSAVDGKNDLVVVWYKSSPDGMAWPNKAVRYIPEWPEGDAVKRIVVASRLGTDGLQSSGGERQFEFDPAKYSDVIIYNQPDKDKPGYNPNEEHALIAPSFYYGAKTPRPPAAFALRHDLNRAVNTDPEYTSDPYVLVQYQDVASENNTGPKMALYRVTMADDKTEDRHDNYNLDRNSDGKIDAEDGDNAFKYSFDYPIYVGDKVVAPYPLDTVIGANSIREILGSNSGTDVNSYWEDKDGNSWVTNKGNFKVSYWYPLLDSFWHPTATVGDIIPLSFESNNFVSDGENYQDFNNEIEVTYTSYWKTNIPEIRLGETLTFQGGEEKKDNPEANGLPSAIAWASAEVIADSRNNSQNVSGWLDNYSVRIRPVVREVRVELASTDFPELLEPATKLTTNKAGKWFFNELHAGLKQRVYYDQTLGKLVLRGVLNERFAGDKLLTKSPGGYDYILQPNMLTIDDLITLRSLHNADDKLKQAFTELYALSIDPNLTKEELSKVAFKDSDNTVVISQQTTKENVSVVEDIRPTVSSVTTDVDEKYYFVSWYDFGTDDTTKYKMKDNYGEAVNAQKAALQKKQRIVTVSLDKANVGIFNEVRVSTTWGKYFTYDENDQTLSYEPEITVVPKNRDVRALISNVVSPSKNELIDMVKVGDEGSILRSKLLALAALILNSKFTSFDSLELSEDGSSLQSKEVTPDGNIKDDISVTYTVGLTRFLRDKNNRFLVTNDTDLTNDGSATKLLLPNGQFPSGVSESDLELVAESELPYGVTIEDVETRIALDSGGQLVRIKQGKGYIPASNLGEGLGLMTNPNLAKPESGFTDSHIVIAENNDSAIKGAPVQLHIFRVNNRPYRGQIKTVLSDNAFDEKITLRHTGDFGANVKDLIFEWYYRETDGLETPPYFYTDPSCSAMGSLGEAAPGPSTNVSLNMPVTGYSSQYPSPNWYASNINQDSLKHGWASIGGGSGIRNEWITLDLGQSQTLNSFTIQAGPLNNRNIKDYVLYGSATGAFSGEEFVISSGTLPSLLAKQEHNVTFTPVSAHHIKLLGTSSYSRYVIVGRLSLFSPPTTGAGAVGADWKPFVDDRTLPAGYAKGQGRYELVFGKTTGKNVLTDNSFYVRYRHKDSEQWSGWAGSGGNNPCSQPEPVFKSQLVKGWVKRVTDQVNVFDARVDSFSGDAPATYVSMIEQVGMPYVGDVALNDDKDVIENVGLAELYQTVLNRAKNLSIDAAQPGSTDGVIQALQNAASRISKFYTLLGNEAYSDALDPTIGYATNDKTYGELAPTIFSFMNQLSTLNEEELVLLRGKSGSQEGDTGGAPVHNRLLWNFTNNDGEAAYALSYNIKDRNSDGFINEDDAKIMYPQGHGDAWGHYLTSLRGYYDLLKHPQFNWVSRAEKYEIDGITLDVDYLDERTFIAAAAYKSKVGSEVVDLTYKDLYQEDPDGQWQGYKDTESYRAWGVDGWVKRSHIGAYYDWVVGNAILTSKDDGNTGIQKIDRETVGEIQDISVNGNAILTKLNEVNSGLNPLGLLPEVVPFDIEPGTAKSHFEQVYERAEEALQSAKSVFDYANNIKHRIRQAADTQEVFKEQIDKQDREYRNRLIELFGTPYDGVIGAGKAYPEGYEGPDVNFYQYIDVADLSEKNLPEQDTELNVYLKTLKSTSFKAAENNVTQTLFHKYFSGDFPEGFTGDLGVPGTENLKYPLTKGRYSFNAPDHWGQRKHPGALQSALIDIVKADTDLHLANKAYTGLIDDLNRIERDIRSRVDLRNSQVEQNGELVSNSIWSNAVVGAAETVIAYADSLKDDTKNLAATMVEALPKNAGLSNDVTSGLRGTIKSVESGVNTAIELGTIAGNAFIKATESRREVLDIKAELVGIDAEEKYEIKQHLWELDALFDSEPELRLATFKAREIVRQAANKYRTVLGESLRLLEERIAFNKKVASKTQGKRYQDMAFRLNRNEASQKYKASFNMAAKYAYLAAKAYDYETNLSERHAASAQHILTDIVKASTLGSFEEGAIIGQGGLADILARLEANFAVLKTQMGFNNPQTELAPFSLRGELFRNKDDRVWESTLADAYVEDIWKIPEFRTHMRPFAAESVGKQPGLVIPFSTTIESGKNFFGKKLSANDHAYDASQFSTRVKSVGIWLEGYNGLGLAETSRAYLVPVGQDIMYVPDSNELDTREWNIKDQKIPVPLPFGKSDLEDASWTPIESLDGAEGLVRRHSRLRVYNDNGGVDQSKMQSDSRLFGRSVWNSRWLLVIPGESLLNPAEEGIQRLIHGNLVSGSNTRRDGNGIDDIKLIFSTYSYSGN